jgi:hypothetical protein
MNPPPPTALPGAAESTERAPRPPAHLTPITRISTTTAGSTRPWATFHQSSTSKPSSASSARRRRLRTPSSSGGSPIAFALRDGVPRTDLAYVRSHPLLATGRSPVEFSRRYFPTCKCSKHLRTRTDAACQTASQITPITEYETGHSWTVCMLKRATLGVAGCPDTEEVTGSIPVSPTTRLGVWCLRRSHELPQGVTVGVTPAPNFEASNIPDI